MPLEQSALEFTEAEQMKHPPYHLRTNKAVDRLLFAEIIRALGPNYKDFTYYSLAGPFLEDLRVIDQFFPDMPIVSLESDEQTFKRQEFNRFSSRIKLLKTTLADFLTHGYSPGSRDIFWLDYTDLKYQRFDEFQRILMQVPPGSVIRITLRAEPEIDLNSLRERISDEELQRMREELEKKFHEEFGKMFSHSTENSAFLTSTKFPRMVQFMVRRAASTALDTTGSAVDYLPVQSTYYNDNTQMISVTGVVCLRTEIEMTREKLKSVRLVNFDWRDPDRINIPALTVKERLHLEHLLPIEGDQDAGEILWQALPYMIDRNKKSSKDQLRHYAECHREYPNFIRISI